LPGIATAEFDRGGGVERAASGKAPPVRNLRIITLAATALVLGGCGSPSDRENAASAAAQRLRQAVAAHDGATACALLAPQTAADLADSTGKPCDQAILDEDLATSPTATQVHVYGQWAQVRFGSRAVFLAVFDGGWRIVAAGCEPQGDQPYDCAIQGG
jgi:hypothetical protein